MRQLQTAPLIVNVAPLLPRLTATTIAVDVDVTMGETSRLS